MVGFHIQDYCLNFVDCCQRSLGCRVDRKNLLVEHGGRTVRVRPLPIGIPFDRFVSLAETAPKVMLTNQKIVLGVDRLDYTKGLVHRLKAFEMLMEKHPEHREEVRYQIFIVTFFLPIGEISPWLFFRFNTRARTE
jgi:trehalose 6-phosphate synthase/phosphatase